MPRTRRPSWKLTAAVSLSLHLLVAGLVPFVDGALEAATVDHHVHVTAPDGESCPPLHNDLTCQFCQVLGRNLVLSAQYRPESGHSPESTRPIIPTASAAPAGAVTHSGLGPRAPPGN